MAWWQAIWDKAASTIGKVAEKVESVVEAVKDTVSGTISKAKEAYSSVADYVKKEIAPIVKAPKKKVEEVKEAAKRAVEREVRKTTERVKDSVSRAAKIIKEEAAPAIKRVKETAKELLKDKPKLTDSQVNAVIDAQRVGLITNEKATYYLKKDERGELTYDEVEEVKELKRKFEARPKDALELLRESLREVGRGNFSKAWDLFKQSLIAPPSRDPEAQEAVMDMILVAATFGEGKAVSEVVKVSEFKALYKQSPKAARKVWEKLSGEDMVKLSDKLANTKAGQEILRAIWPESTLAGITPALFLKKPKETAKWYAKLSSPEQIGLITKWQKMTGGPQAIPILIRESIKSKIVSKPKTIAWALGGILGLMGMAYSVSFGSEWFAKEGLIEMITIPLSDRMRDYRYEPTKEKKERIEEDIRRLEETTPKAKALISSVSWLWPFTKSAWDEYAESLDFSLKQTKDEFKEITEREIILTPETTPETITAKVREIIDGDTIKARWEEGNTTLDVRLVGINSPEKGEKGYKEAKEWLAEKIYGEEVEIKIDQEHRVDAYDRILGTIYKKGENVNLEMLRAGWAFYYPYEDNKFMVKNVYELAEAGAKEGRKGIWGLVGNIGDLYISSSPTHARIFLDGKDTMKITAETLKDLEEGDYSLKLELKGYYPVEEKVEVIKDKKTEYFFKMEKLPKELADEEKKEEILFTITSTPDNAKVYIDEAYTNHLTPTDEEEQKDKSYLWTEGKHVLRITKGGYMIEDIIELKKGIRFKKHYDLPGMIEPAVPGVLIPPGAVPREEPVTETDEEIISRMENYIFEKMSGTISDVEAILGVTMTRPPKISIGKVFEIIDFYKRAVHYSADNSIRFNRSYWIEQYKGNTNWFIDLEGSLAHELAHEIQQEVIGLKEWPEIYKRATADMESLARQVSAKVRLRDISSVWPFQGMGKEEWFTGAALPKELPPEEKIVEEIITGLVPEADIPKELTAEQETALILAFQEIERLTGGKEVMSTEERERLIDSFTFYSDGQKKVLYLLWRDLEYYTAGKEQLSEKELQDLKDKYHMGGM